MKNDEAMIAASKAMYERCPQPGSRWRHRSGGEYVVIQGCVIEATLTPAVLYQSVDPCGTLQAMWMSSWVRPLDEFLDGRFIRVGEGTT